MRSQNDFVIMKRNNFLLPRRLGLKKIVTLKIVTLLQDIFNMSAPRRMFAGLLYRFFPNRYLLAAFLQVSF